MAAAFPCVILVTQNGVVSISKYFEHNRGACCGCIANMPPYAPSFHPVCSTYGPTATRGIVYSIYIVHGKKIGWNNCQKVPSKLLTLDLMETLDFFFRKAYYYQNASYRNMKRIKVVEKL
jgi:hypothetical protein